MSQAPVDVLAIGPHPDDAELLSSLLNTTYGPFSTFGKSANICGDIATRYLKKPGRIKAFVGGDRFRFEGKYLHAFSAEPSAKLVFSMNELPRTDDETDERQHYDGEPEDGECGHQQRRSPGSAAPSSRHGVRNP